MTITYHVEWTIDIEADGPAEAAERAREIQQDPESIATVFRVTDGDWHSWHVDLTEKDVRSDS